MNVSLYIMQSGDCQKVGIAGDASKRKAQMQTGNPNFVSIHIVSVPVPRATALQLERRVHELLAEYRQRGEWFRCGLVEAYEASRQAVSEWRFRLGLKTEVDIDDFFGMIHTGRER